MDVQEFIHSVRAGITLPGEQDPLGPLDLANDQED